MLNSVVTNQCPQQNYSTKNTLTLKTAMMLQTGSWNCFSFFFLLFMLHLSPILAYILNDCTILYSDNITAGVSVDCHDCNLASIPHDIPRDVISLTLEHNLIQKINRTDFYNLSNLANLVLSNNSITHVDDGAFVPLVQLKVLNMDDNNLTTLTDDMFQGLSKLLILRLDYNNIQFFNPAAFQSLTSLQELSLSSNKIRDIITVLKLSSLYVLNISIDELESFQSKDLPLNMSSELRKLRVDSQSIKRFSVTTALFPNLNTIDLSQCCDANGWEWDIPDKYFRRIITTVYLTCSNMSLDTTKKALQRLDSLENLQLRLTDVWIDQDLLNIICKIPTLRNLSVIGNINDLNKTLSHCTQLTNLELSENGLSKVPDDVKNLSMLQILDLSKNRIHDLSCLDFLNLTRLTHLHLDHNHIYELKRCVFQHLNELKVLTLNHNIIEKFGNTFKTGLHKLESLDLRKNNVYQLSKGEFMSLKSLKQLDMEFNNEEGRHPWNKNYLEGLNELETLCLNFKHDPFKMTPSSPHELERQNYNTALLRSLKNLTIQFSPEYYDLLYILRDMLSESDMKHLEHMHVVHGKQPDTDSFKYVPQLKTLSLKSCSLTSLDFLAQANLTRLSWLDVSQNELTVINVTLLKVLPALSYIKMNDNPLACDCSNADFMHWMLDNNQTLVVGAHNYTCAYPLVKKGTRFLDFDYHSCREEDTGVDTSFICFISSTCVIVLTLLTSFIYHFLRLHYLFRPFFYDTKERERGSPQRYDAFISYNVHDELWVCVEMLPVLEGEQGWRLCLHHRDFIPGTPIIENITEAIFGSRKTICVISKHYLESEWCSREFQMASYRLFDEQKDVLILVFLEDIPAHQLSPYMRRLVKRHTYLSWSQDGHDPELFFQKFRRALDT